LESLDVSATELERRKREVCHSEDKGWTRVGGDFSRGLDMGVGKTREVRLGERRGWG